MATHKSALKHQRQSEKRRMRNVSIKSYLKTITKKARKAVEEKDKTGASQALAEAVSAFDKAASKGIIHKKMASRRISRLTRGVNTLDSNVSDQS